MKKNLKSLLIGAIAGALIYQIAVYLIGFTSAFSIPSHLINWAKANSVVGLTMFVWEILIVQFIGVGILVSFVTYVLTRKLNINFHSLVIALVVTESVFAYSSLPEFLRSSQTTISVYLQLSLHFWVVLVCALVAGYFGRKQKHL